MQTILDTPSAQINLQGISVGDPVMNSVVQWPTYADTLYGMGLVNLLQREQIRSIMNQGVQALQTGTCKQAFDFWNSVWNDNGELPNPFYYQKFSGSSTTYEQLLVNDPESMAWSTNWLATSQVPLLRREFFFPYAVAGSKSPALWTITCEPAKRRRACL